MIARHRLKSIRARLTLWYLLVLLFVLALFGIAVYLALSSILYATTDQLLENAAFVLVDAGISGSGGLESADGESRSPWTDSKEGEHFWRVVNPDGTVVSTSQVTPEPSVAVDIESVRAAASGADVFQTTSHDNNQIRVYSTPLYQNGHLDGVLQIGMAIDDIVGTLVTFRWILFIMVPATLLLASWGGLFLVDRLLRPVHRITETAERISSSDLNLRIGDDLPDDELGRLARTFDSMIARLSQSFERQRQFVSDASHELRTPLTVLKGDVSLALSRERNARYYRRVLRRAREEVDRLEGLTNQLLDLSVAERSDSHTGRQRVDVATVLSAVVARFSGRAAEKGVSLIHETGAQPGVMGEITTNPDALTRILHVLVDNAIGYTSAGSITLSARRRTASLAISVADTGPGIPPHDLPHVFERFYRVDASRNRQQGGAGIGLAIAKELSVSIGAEITVGSTPGEGTEFVVVLPAERTRERRDER